MRPNLEKLERLFRGKHKYYKKELKADILTVKMEVFNIKIGIHKS